LVYAGRGGAGIANAELKRLWLQLSPLAIKTMPLAAPPPRKSHFGSPLELSRVHWVRPELVVEVKFLAWTEQGLLRLVFGVPIFRTATARPHKRLRPPDLDPEPTFAKGKDRP
jgi:ATP-dependent DNA ligase